WSSDVCSSDLSQGMAKRETGNGKSAKKTAAKQQALQSEVEQKRSKSKDGKPSKKATRKAIEERGVQAGARVQPSKMPAQHLRKPGKEAELELAPRYDAPDYKGSGKLAGMVAI